MEREREVGIATLPDSDDYPDCYVLTLLLTLLDKVLRYEDTRDAGKLPWLPPPHIRIIFHIICYHPLGASRRCGFQHRYAQRLK